MGCIIKMTYPRLVFPNDTIERDYGLSQNDDYHKNVRPYEQQGYRIVPQGDHRFGYFVITGWRVLYTGSNRAMLQ